MLNSRQTVTQISILKNTNKKQLITCYIYIYIYIWDEISNQNKM